jgi:hypothetical protein
VRTVCGVAFLCVLTTVIVVGVSLHVAAAHIRRGKKPGVK